MQYMGCDIVDTYFTPRGFRAQHDQTHALSHHKEELNRSTQGCNEVSEQSIQVGNEFTNKSTKVCNEVSEQSIKVCKLHYKLLFTAHMPHYKVLLT